MKEELKPCPFCGKPAKWEKNFLQSGIARCSDYHCIGAFTHLSRSATIREWNTRPVEDALKAEIEEVREVLSELVWLYSDELRVSRECCLTVKDGFDWEELHSFMLEKAREILRGEE